MYYIYIWYIVGTLNVFYVGRGHGDRYKTLKKRTEYFMEFYDDHDCDSMIIMDHLSEEEAMIAEELVIAFFRGRGMALANIHNGGGAGGDVISHMPEDRKLKFVEKMTGINRERCATEEFRKACSRRTRERYQDSSERLKQSEKIHAYWTGERRIACSERRKAYVAAHPEMVEKRAQKLCKPVRVEYEGQTFEFPSLKAAKAFLWGTYGFKPGERSKEQDMLHNKTPYTTTWEKKKRFEGLKMYYAV